MDNFGTDPHKLHRKAAPDTSVNAAYRVDTAKDEEIVFKHICAAGDNGLTNKELVDLMGKPMNTFSGRISALLEKNMVRDKGERRDRCRVIVAVREGDK